MRRVLALLLLVPTSFSVSAEFPPTRRVDQVDTYHGTQVADPYRWLEGDVRESPEVAAWVAAQSDYARAHLDAIPARQKFERRLKQLYNYERFSAPSKKAGRYFFYQNDGLQDQAVLYVADSPGGEGRPLLDPNAWSDDGTVALANFSVSNDGQLIAFAKSLSGSDWKKVYVMEVASGERRSDQIDWVRFGGMEWDHQGKGFYYSRYPEPKEGKQFQSVALNQQLCYHRLGTEQTDDQVIYDRPDHPEWTFYAEVSDDGELLVLSISRSTDPQNQVWIQDLTKTDADWRPLADNFDHEYGFIAKQANRLFFLTDEAAPQKRIVAVDLVDLTRRTEIIPETDATLDDVDLVGGRLFVQYLRHVHAEVKIHALDGKSLGTVKLPGIGAVGGFHGDADDQETFYAFTNSVTPTSIYRYDLATDKSQVLRKPAIEFASDQYVVEQVFFPSKDGTKIPMTLAYRQGLQRDGKRPTLLYAYGGFAISITPQFSVDYAAWMEQGGVLAIANLRGGGEYGEAWHQAGKKANKQNVFDDFIAAAEWLIDNRFTSPDRLAIKGGSNGGLLVGAVMTQRPELFGACLPAVGVHDMLRFHQFTAGQFWRSEFGSSEEPDEFPALLAYSPVHNVTPGTKYPATMVITADTDDRVVPMHSFKFGAALQHAQAGDAPILLRVEIKAGHGAGTPISKRIAQTADAWAFLADVFDMEIQEKPR